MDKLIRKFSSRLWFIYQFHYSNWKMLFFGIFSSNYVINFKDKRICYLTSHLHKCIFSTQQLPCKPTEGKVYTTQVCISFPRIFLISFSRISETRWKEMQMRSNLFFPQVEYVGWKLTAALQPGKLKKVSGPCLCGIWLRTDNSLTACLGCENKKIAQKSIQPLSYSLGYNWNGTVLK